MGDPATPPGFNDAETRGWARECGRGEGNGGEDDRAGRDREEYRREDRQGEPHCTSCK